MKRSNFHAALLILIFTGFIQFVHAQGIIVTSQSRIPRIETLRIEKHHVNVSIDNQLATTKIDQIFANPNDFQLEGTYLFPLPDDVAVSDFVLYIDGKPVKGELLAKDRARSIYEGIVRSMQDPALLEYIGTRAFQARVFPIPPNGERRIQLEYSQVISVDSGLAKYTYPLRTDTYTHQPVGSLAVSIDLKSKHALKTIYSPSHEIAVNRKNDHRANISYEGTDVHVKRDFVCYYSLSDKDFGIDLITHRDNTDEDGFFMLLISPKYEVKRSEVIEKDFIFILDRSGSMKGPKIEQAKEALRFCVNSLNDGDRFNLILFNTDVEPFSEKLVSVKEERKNALAFVDDIVGNGGTNINDALLAALDDEPDPKRPRIIVFLTDGEATVGETDTTRILKNVTGENSDKSRIFVFGVGYDVNVNLLDKMAEQNGGTRQYVKPKENLEVAVSSFFTKVSEPILVNLGLDIQNIKTKNLYPQKLPHLFRGSQLTVLGRYAGTGKTKLTLRGDINGKKHEFSNVAKFPKQESDHQFLPKLWAQRKVAYLVDAIRLNGENKELVEEIARLSEKYGIMTPYTSFLVTEDGPQRRQLSRARGRSVPLSAVQAPSPKAKLVPDAKQQIEESIQLQALQKQAQVAETAVTVQQVKNKTFHLREKVWVDSTHKPETETKKIEFGSDAYFELLKKEPELTKYLAIGKHVIVCHKATCYEIHPPKQPQVNP
ncbi:MAG: VIT domain-containing protein [Candidatus Poribacteria bacterium]|nr:VIT domain-containing protein [Candidatus Poribacteria bacterium]